MAAVRRPGVLMMPVRSVKVKAAVNCPRTTILLERSLGKKRGRSSNLAKFMAKQGDLFPRESYLARLEARYPYLPPFWCLRRRSLRPSGRGHIGAGNVFPLATNCSRDSPLGELYRAS